MAQETFAGFPAPPRKSDTSDSPGHRHRAYPRSWGYPVWGYGFGYVPRHPVAPMVVDGQPAPSGVYADDPVVATALAGDLTVGTTGPLLGSARTSRWLSPFSRPQ